MRRITIFAIAIIFGLMHGLPSSHGAVITFIAGDETVGLSSPATVPITVSGFTDVTTFQFTLEWDPNVIQYVSVGNFDLVDLTIGKFGTTQVGSGILTVSWNEDVLLGQDLEDDWRIFDVNFISAGSAGSTDVLFTGNVTELEVSTLVGGDPTEQIFNPIHGSVTVVPEPINIALGVFAGLFVGTMPMRWVFRKRSAQLAQ